jgi:AraC-like DNA-binding protein
MLCGPRAAQRPSRLAQEVDAMSVAVRNGSLPNYLDDTTMREHRRVYEAAMQIVEEDYPQQLTMRVLAMRIGCSPVTVRKACAAFGDGLPLRDYLRGVRLRRAAELLESWPGVRVSDIASTVGYRHPTYFASEFRREFGMAPAAYRFLALNPERRIEADAAGIMVLTSGE